MALNEKAEESRNCVEPTKQLPLMTAVKMTEESLWCVKVGPLGRLHAKRVALIKKACEERSNSLSLFRGLIYRYWEPVWAGPRPLQELRLATISTGVVCSDLDNPLHQCTLDKYKRPPLFFLSLAHLLLISFIWVSISRALLDPIVFIRLLSDNTIHLLVHPWQSNEHPWRRRDTHKHNVIFKGARVTINWMSY